MTDSAYLAQLSRGCEQLGLALDSNTLDKLLAYHQLLVKWNKAYNLTAVRDPGQMISLHLLDSLSLLPFVNEQNYQRIADVGSGAGLPGVLLAICRPEMAVTSIDSNGKKTRFQLQAKLELGLDNLTVINGRTEDCREEPFEAVVSRAFASLSDMLTWTGQLCAQDGVFLAMKGQYPSDEIAQLPSGFELQSYRTLAVPGVDAERHLMILGRAE